jgi:hypothetical protein
MYVKGRISLFEDNIRFMDFAIEKLENWLDSSSWPLLPRLSQEYSIGLWKSSGEMRGMDILKPVSE